MNIESGYIGLQVDSEEVYHHDSSHLRDGDGVSLYVHLKTRKMVVADDDFLMQQPDDEYIYIGVVLEDPDHDDELLLVEHELFENMFEVDDDHGIYGFMTEDEVS